MAELTRYEAMREAHGFGIRAGVAALNGAELEAWVWGFGAAHYAHAAQLAAARDPEAFLWLDPFDFEELYQRKRTQLHRGELADVRVVRALGRYELWVNGQRIALAHPEDV